MKGDKSKAVILVNLDADTKKAGKKWPAIEKQVLKKMPPATSVIAYHVPFNIKQCLEDQIRHNKVNCIISAGGDGSGNIILNELMRFPHDHISELNIGFIGLGSSNDLLKPYDAMIGNIPIKINLNRIVKSDLGLATYINVHEETKKRYFLANSSIGVGASANRFFNRGDPLIQFLKVRWLNLAIGYAIIKSILGFRNYPVEIQYHGTKKDFLVSHLSILKNPHVSGDLKFDQEIAPDDGNLGLNICENMSKIQLIGVMKDLQKGVFSGKPQRHSSYVKDLWIKPQKIIPVEFDGEIELAKEITYRVIPRYINLLQ